MSLPLFDDICSNRHRGNEASIAANKTVNKSLDRDRVLAIIKEGPTYSKSIARRMGRNLNEISGRISELKAQGKIVETAERREKCCVVRAV